ncbi:MAG: DJ-1/PfpI family protein [Lentisphaerae bacterium]|nr:DJ-1/PfpI family protein [Lentisphaerota bacterium]
MKRVLVPVAEGTEEMEAVIVIDVLRRAGCEVFVAGLDAGTIRGSRGVRIEPDGPWSAAWPADFDALVLPGGAGGTRRFCAHGGLLDAVRAMHAAGRLVAAVCAAPLALQAAGVLAGRRATCHPDVAERLTSAVRCDDAVVVDGTLVTSQGAGTCFAFALEIVARLCGRDAADRIAGDIVLRG